MANISSELKEYFDNKGITQADIALKLGDYSAPFSIYNNSTPLENKFIYSGDKEMSSLNNGKANLKGYIGTFYRPNIEVLSE